MKKMLLIVMPFGNSVQWNAPTRRGKIHRFCNPKGIVSSSPGLRGTSYPGSLSASLFNPNRVVSGFDLRAATPLGSWAWIAFPRVAHASQPWALRRNLFGNLLRNFRKALWLIGCLAVAAASLADGAKPLYENNFENAQVSKVPDDFLVLDGGFAVRQDGDNKFLELPGAPLDTFGALFGPTEKDGVAVSARVHGGGKGRRFPTFAVGLNGVAGYRLQVSPGKKALELYRGDTVKASVPFEWASDKWTHLRLQVRKIKDGQWKIEGKAWTQDASEPAWLISFDETEAPPAGRAAVWGCPYSGTPIRFDDLSVVLVAEKN